MPKRARITQEDSPLRPTIGGRRPVSGTDRVRSLGVTLRDSEIVKLGAMAEDLGVSRNALAVWLIRHGIAEMEGGHLTPKTEKIEQIKLAM